MPVENIGLTFYVKFVLKGVSQIQKLKAPLAAESVNETKSSIKTKRKLTIGRKISSIYRLKMDDSLLLN